MFNEAVSTLLLTSKTCRLGVATSSRSVEGRANEAMILFVAVVRCVIDEWKIREQNEANTDGKTRKRMLQKAAGPWNEGKAIIVEGRGSPVEKNLGMSAGAPRPPACPAGLAGPIGRPGPLNYTGLLLPLYTPLF